MPSFTLPRLSADRLDAAARFATAALCLVPTVGFLLAWHMQVDLGAFTRLAIMPALLLLSLAQLRLAKRDSSRFQRYAAGIVGGVAATLAFDAVRLPAALLFKGAPDYVPLIGQLLLNETIGIAPSASAIAVGYGFHYVLMGALLGGAFALVTGRGVKRLAPLAGAAVGVGFALLPQFQLLALAKGFTLSTAMLVLVVAFTVAGLVLGRALRSGERALNVAFLRHMPVAERR